LELQTPINVSRDAAGVAVVEIARPPVNTEDGQTPAWRGENDRVASLCRSVEYGEPASDPQESAPVRTARAAGGGAERPSDAQAPTNNGSVPEAVA